MAGKTKIPAILAGIFTLLWHFGRYFAILFGKSLIPAKI